MKHLQNHDTLMTHMQIIPKLFIGVFMTAAIMWLTACGANHSLTASNKTGKKTAEPTELFYVKGTSLYGMDIKAMEKEPVEYTENFTTASEVYDVTGYFWKTFHKSFVPLVTKDGRYHFILEDVEADESSQQLKTYTLLYQKDGEKPVRVDNKISGNYVVTDDNRVVYKKNGNLYVSDLTDRKKLDSDIDTFYVSDDGKHVMWTVASSEDANEGELYNWDTRNMCDIYYQDIEQKTEKNVIQIR